MATLAGSGSNRHNDAYRAGQAAAEQALASLDGQPPTLVVLFTTDRYDQGEVIRGVRSVTGNAALIGCCTGGCISAEGPSTDGVAMLAIHSRAMNVTLAVEEGIRDQPVLVAERVAEQIEAQLPPLQSGIYPSALVLADGLTGSLTEVVESTATVLGPICQLAGGGAGDNLKFLQTSQFVNDRVYSDAIAMALITTPTPIGIGVHHGWTPIGRSLVVTRSQGNVVYELDGRPALEAYRLLFPTEQITPENFAAIAMAHPLGLPQAGHEFLIRDPIRARSDGAIECVATVPEHAVAHIMQGDPPSLFAAAQAAARRAVEGLGGREPAAVLVFDCVSRLLMLGEDANTEIGLIRDIVGHDTPVVGMFSFGEIAADRGPAGFHNKTVVVYAIGKD